MIRDLFGTVGKIAACLALAATSGCVAGDSSAPSSETVTTTGDAVSFDQWKEKVRLRPGRDVYAVGDRITPLGLVGDEEAYGYYLRHIAAPGALTIHNGQTDKGTPVNVSAFPRGMELNFCIDRTAWEQVAEDYGLPSDTDLYAYVEEAFLRAAATWNNVLDGKITYVSDRSRTCTPRSGDDITWYVRPMVLQNPLQYLTFVLHPNHNRANPEYREFLILDYLVQRPFPGAFRLDGEPNWDSMFSMDELLLRAIANGLGFIDESNRGGVPGDGGNVYWPAECRNDGTHNDNDLLTPDPVGGVFLSDADPYSVTTHPRAMKDIMALPQCSGSRPRGYALSYRDVMGAACQYRELNPLYYCAQYAQNSIASRYGADCSPFPLSAGGPGDCGTNSDESFWQDPKRASDFNQAILDAIQ